jgi:hypothetical protein
VLSIEKAFLTIVYQTLFINSALVLIAKTPHFTSGVLSFLGQLSGYIVKIRFFSLD